MEKEPTGSITKVSESCSGRIYKRSEINNYLHVHVLVHV